MGLYRMVRPLLRVQSAQMLVYAASALNDRPAPGLAL